MDTALRLRSIATNRMATHILIYIVLSSVVFFVMFVLDKSLDIPLYASFSWGLLVLSMVLNRVSSFKEAPGRFIFILTAGLISLRYFLWRTFETLIYTGPMDFTGTLLIYIAECYALTIHFLGMFMNVWPIERKSQPLPQNPALLPTVDVLIPTYMEPEDIVRLTVTAATQIDYPKEKLRIYILDDGSTVLRRNNPETSDASWNRHYGLKRLAHELGVNYLTREKNDHAKAGNLNHALKKTDGDLILVLDSDHVPTRDILNNTVGSFISDRKLFLVQTPHFFINSTTVEKNIGSFSNAPGENDMFYHGIQLGMDLWNSSYFCGSAAVLRRKFLMESGGIAGNTVTEDAETSLRLHSKGYNSVFIRRPMVCGLSPETFDNYIVQRTRWAQGMLQIFMLFNPLLAKGLTIPQRLCYFNSCFFWFFGIARFIFYIAPGFFLLFGYKVYHASIIQIMSYAMPHVLAIFIVMDFFYSKVRRKFFSEIYESVQSIFLTPAVIFTMLNPKKPFFRITPKGKTVQTEFINPMASAFFLICMINFVAIPIAVFKWFYYPLFRSVILVTFGWCMYNLILALITLGAFWERRQMRQYHRVKSKAPVDLVFPRMGRSLKGESRDISLTGMGVELEMPFEAHPKETVRIEATDSYGYRHELQASVKTQRDRGGGKTLLGIEFALEGDAYSKIVGFVYGDSQRWMNILEERCRPPISSKVVFADMYYFLTRGLKGSGERFIHIAGVMPAALKKYFYRLFSWQKRLSLKGTRP